MTGNDVPRETVQDCTKLVRYSEYRLFQIAKTAVLRRRFTAISECTQHLRTAASVAHRDHPTSPSKRPKPRDRSGMGVPREDW